MICPNCGDRLAWEDGAFCAACMDAAESKIYLQQEKEKRDKLEAYYAERARLRKEEEGGRR